MRFIIVTAAMACLSGGCVTSHLDFDNSRIAEETTPISVSGYAGIASDEVVLEGWFPSTSTWTALDTTTSGTYDSNGFGNAAMYSYSFDPIVVPSGYWQHDCVKLWVTERGYALAVFEATVGWDCLVDEYNSNGSDWVNAGTTCRVDSDFSVCTVAVDAPH